MICLHDQIRYTNVLSKQYELPYPQMKEKLEEFLAEVKEYHVHQKGPLFYTINQVQEQIVTAEFYVPIKEETVMNKGDMHFHSYFSVEHMMSMRVRGDITRQVPIAYSAILHLMEAMQVSPVTPPFHIMDTVGEEPFLTIKIGYIENERNERVKWE